MCDSDKGMKHHAFVEIVSQATAVPEKTVAIFARNLKSAGLLTSGARGVNAPEMTLLDLTRMVIALCATDRPSDAVEATNRYRTARCTNATVIKIANREIQVPVGEQLEDLLSNLLAIPFAPFVNMSLHLFIHWNRLEAELLIFGNRIIFGVSKTAAETDAQSMGSFRGISTRRGLGSDELEQMVAPFFLEGVGGKTWEEIANDGNVAEVFAQYAFGLKGTTGKRDMSGPRSEASNK